MAFKNEKNPNCIISYKRLQHENVKLFKLKKNNGLIYNNTIYRLETLQRVYHHISALLFQSYLSEIIACDFVNDKKYKYIYSSIVFQRLKNEH